jgi:glycosyltransferase involved in cell wall biosynthesis
MLVAEGHEVLPLRPQPHRKSRAARSPARFPEDLEKSYPGWDWKQDGFPKFSKDDHVYRKFYERAIRQIERRKQPNDFLLCTFGDWHKPVADAHSDMIVVESGIGYPNGSFARYRVFESYAIMHAYQGNTAAASATENAWYDAVIPNQIDLRDFKYEPVRGGYLLFLGRLNAGKGIHIAKQLADSTMTPLIIAGPGDPGDLSPLHTCVGNVGPDKRKLLLAGAKAVICASTFLEPFCGVQIEAMASGAPVISSDRGAFAEYNKHGVTGYRCKTYEQFDWAVRNIGDIAPRDCRTWATRFAIEAIAPMYTDYFQSVLDIHTGRGWYEPRDRRTLATASFSA